MRGGRDAAGSGCHGSWPSTTSGRTRADAPRRARRAVATSSSSSPSTQREELDADRAEHRGRVALFVLARGATSAARSASGSHVPFEPSVQTQQVHLGAGVGPLRERRAAPELDVVGMGADREHPRRYREVDA